MPLDELTPEQGRNLRAPFPEAFIKQRAGRGGQRFNYITARDVMDRLDAVVGPSNWSSVYRRVDVETGAVECRLTIYGVTKADVGYPNNPESDQETEKLKAAYSDALKRAAVQWGVGRFLYGPSSIRQFREDAEATGEGRAASPSPRTDGPNGHAPASLSDAVLAPDLQRRIAEAARRVPISVDDVKSLARTKYSSAVRDLTPEQGVELAELIESQIRPGADDDDDPAWGEPPMAEADEPSGFVARVPVEKPRAKTVERPALAATEPQVRACYAIAKGVRSWDEAKLDAYSEATFGVRPHGLSRRQASELIDWLKGGG